MLLAFLPRACDKSEGERDVLGGEAGPQRAPRPRHRPTARGERLGGRARVGARTCRRRRRCDRDTARRAPERPAMTTKKAAPWAGGTSEIGKAVDELSAEILGAYREADRLVLEHANM